MSFRLRHACALAFAVVLAACGETTTEPATQIIVAITSDIELERRLSRVEVTLGDREGEDVTAMRNYTLAKDDPEDGQFELPLSFSVTKGAQKSFLIEVTGYGPLGEDGAEVRIVEHRAIATFQAGRTLLLKIFLGNICLFNFCENDRAQVCYPADELQIEAGECGAVIAYGPDGVVDLETVDVRSLPDLSLPPGNVMTQDAGADGDVHDGGDGDGDGDGDTSCTDEASCDDGMFCTIDSCGSEGECDYEARECAVDSNPCTLPPVCDEAANECVEAFDETSLSDEEHCASSATSSCMLCVTGGPQSTECIDGRCQFECEPGRVDADGDDGNGCECTFVSEEDISDDLAEDTNCDGADGVVDGDYFIYVTPRGAGDHSGRTPGNAVTIDEAFELAIASGTAQQMLLAAGTYIVTLPLEPPDNLIMFGGYVEDFRSREGTSTMATLGRTLLRILNTTSGVIIDSIDLKTEDQTAASATTHTVVIDNSHAAFRRLVITAGAGGPGAPGAAGTTAGGSMGMGDSGDAALSISGGLGGGNGMGGNGPGGNGGNGGAYLAGVPAGGASGISGDHTTGMCGNPGPAGPASDNQFCMDVPARNPGSPGMPGMPGCTGAVGRHGNGGSGPGSLAAGTWIANAATMGDTGETGGSGGGGGGGGAIECGAAGAAGGGGGEGGPGGAGGGGGQPGGAGGGSIGVIVTGSSSTIAFEGAEIRTGNGGRGGQGGNGGGGGLGGTGGSAGSGSSGSAGNSDVEGGSGGGGGRGGQGGRGGCGGGGVGGPSVGIFIGDGAMIEQGPAFRIGTAGSGGAVCATTGGNPGNNGAQSMTFPL